MSKYIDRAFADFLPDFTKYCENSDIETAKKTERLLGLKLDLPKNKGFSESYREIEYMAKANGGSALPIIIDPSAVLDTPDSLADLLLDATDAFLETIAIVKFPASEPVVWAEKEFGNEKISVFPASERIASLQKILAEMLGAVPAVFVFGDDSASLLLPLENGVYIRITKSLS